jgi:CTP:molybdopterin cytidylyltransferase MocA
MEKGGAKKVSGVILAAGLGSRFGGGKLMHRVLGQPLFSYALESALASDLHQVVMVCGLETAKAAPHDPRLICLVNPRPEKGQAGSLRLGLNRISPDADHVLFMLADQPLITPELLNRYVSLAARGAQMVCMGRGITWDLRPCSAEAFLMSLINLKATRARAACCVSIVRICGFWTRGMTAPPGMWTGQVI